MMLPRGVNVLRLVPRVQTSYVYANKGDKTPSRRIPFQCGWVMLISDNVDLPDTMTFGKHCYPIVKMSTCQWCKSEGHATERCPSQAKGKAAAPEGGAGPGSKDSKKSEHHTMNHMLKHFGVMCYKTTNNKTDKAVLAMVPSPPRRPQHASTSEKQDGDDAVNTMDMDELNDTVNKACEKDGPLLTTPGPGTWSEMVEKHQHEHGGFRPGPGFEFNNRSRSPNTKADNFLPGLRGAFLAPSDKCKMTSPTPMTKQTKPMKKSKHTPTSTSAALVDEGGGGVQDQLSGAW